ncbi:MAG: DUF58 domain-containing protein [Candidatus Heimdallarchaeota archaeon]|nr:DUF58 domain-containing protein [Candidatus Heimdallarchaeota archaeon]MCK4878673.1 DUF58 domain-containing protein [Candidatus Heimdallarchaeota archaeon]
MFTRRGGWLVFAGVIMISVGFALAGYLSLNVMFDSFGFSPQPNSTVPGETEPTGGFGVMDFLHFYMDRQGTLIWFFIIGGVMLIFSVLLGLPFYRLGANPKSIEIRRRVSKPKAFAGDYMYIEVTARNRSVNQLPTVEIYDAIPEVFDLVLGENFIVTQLNPRQSVSYGYVVRIPIRGLFEIGPTKVIIRDRMGFYATEGEIKTKTEILVYPSYEDVKKLEMIGRKRQLGVLFGFHRTKIRGMGTDFWGIRQYQTGDAFKFIDWKAFSRSGKMMVREYESEENIRVVILLDSSASMGAGLPRNTKLEYAIRSAVLMIHLAFEKSDIVGLCIYDDEIRNWVDMTSVRSRLFSFLEALAHAKPQGEADMEVAIEYVLQRVKRAAYIVVISDLESNPQKVINAVRRARARKHNITVISPFGPWFEIVSQQLSPVEQMIGHAMVEKQLGERQNMFKLLRRYDSTSVSVGPDDFLPTIMAQFNRMQRQG